MSSDTAAKGPRRNIRIGKYEVLSHVATGGMGAVYKARDTETGQDVALKVLSPEMAAKPGMVERFRREAKHAAKLRHENVVTLHEFCEASRTYFLVMEFIDGIDLHDYSNRKGALDPQEALEIIVQACRAIDHAYQQGVIHRDIKPSNFLLTQQGERRVVKLTDLGLAREANDEEFRVTRAGTTVGTLDYMSPEQARDSGSADIRSDLYSLGSTWYHLLAGHAPFPKGGLGERLHRIMHEDPPDIRQANPNVPAAMASVLHRLMAKSPAQRYQTPEDLLRDLEALQRGESLLTPRQLLEGLALEEGEAIEPPRKKSRASSRSANDGRRTPQSLPSRARPDTKMSKSTAEVPIAAAKASKAVAEAPSDEAEPAIRPHLWYGLGGAAAIVLVVGVAVALSLRRGRHDDSIVEQTPSGRCNRCRTGPSFLRPARRRWHRTRRRSKRTRFPSEIRTPTRNPAKARRTHFRRKNRLGPSSINRPSRLTPPLSAKRSKHPGPRLPPRHQRSNWWSAACRPIRPARHSPRSPTPARPSPPERRASSSCAITAHSSTSPLFSPIAVSSFAPPRAIVPSWSGTCSALWRSAAVTATGGKRPTQMLRWCSSMCSAAT